MAENVVSTFNAIQEEGKQKGPPPVFPLYLFQS